jgi:hypothetical protein
MNLTEVAAYPTRPQIQGVLDNFPQNSLRQSKQAISGKKKTLVSNDLQDIIGSYQK